MVTHASLRGRARSLVTCIAVGALLAAAEPAVAKPRVAVDRFSGSRAHKLRTEVVKLLMPRYSIVAPERIAAAIEKAGADFGVATIARLLKVDAFVIGAVTKRRREWYLSLSIQSGKTGRQQAALDVRLNSRRAWTPEVERQVKAWLEHELPGAPPQPKNPKPAKVNKKPAGNEGDGSTGEQTDETTDGGADDGSGDVEDATVEDATVEDATVEDATDDVVDASTDAGTDVATADDMGDDEIDELDTALNALEGGAGGSAKKGVTDFRGDLASEFRTYPFDREGPKKDEQFLIETEVEMSVSLSGGASFFFLPRFLIDTMDTEVERFEPYEGYFQYTGETWDWRAGQFVENWGIADAYNPIDVLNRRDYAPDVLDPKRLGELGTRLRKTFPSLGPIGEPTVSLYAMPLWRETLLPSDDYRYSLSQAPFVLNDDPVTPEVKDQVFAAIRLQHTLSTSLFSADLKYIGARGPARFPNLTPVPQMDGSIQLQTEYFGSWIAGGGFRLVPNAPWWSKLTLKTEVAYFQPYLLDGIGMQAPDRYIQYAAGFDRMFNGLFTDLDALTMTVEYLGENLADDLLSTFRPFDHDVAVRLFWEAKDFSRTSLELRGVVDVKNGELIGEADIGRQLRFIHDDLSLEIETQWIRPARDEQTFFSFFPNNSNVRVRLDFNF